MASRRNPKQLQHEEHRRLRIAVIGANFPGLAVSNLLSEGYDVTLFEKVSEEVAYSRLQIPAVVVPARDLHVARLLLYIRQLEEAKASRRAKGTRKRTRRDQTEKIKAIAKASSSSSLFSSVELFRFTDISPSVLEQERSPFFILCGRPLKAFEHSLAIDPAALSADALASSSYSLFSSLWTSAWSFALVGSSITRSLLSSLYHSRRRWHTLHLWYLWIIFCYRAQRDLALPRRAKAASQRERGRERARSSLSHGDRMRRSSSVSSSQFLASSSSSLSPSFPSDTLENSQALLKEGNSEPSREATRLSNISSSSQTLEEYLRATVTPESLVQEVILPLLSSLLLYPSYRHILLAPSRDVLGLLLEVFKGNAAPSGPTLAQNGTLDINRDIFDFLRRQKSSEVEDSDQKEEVAALPENSKELRILFQAEVLSVFTPESGSQNLPQRGFTTSVAHLSPGSAASKHPFLSASTVLVSKEDIAEDAEEEDPVSGITAKGFLREEREGNRTFPGSVCIRMRRKKTEQVAEEVEEETELYFDHVIIATNAPTAFTLLEEKSIDIHAALMSLPYCSVARVDFSPLPSNRSFDSSSLARPKHTTWRFPLLPALSPFRWWRSGSHSAHKVNESSHVELLIDSKSRKEYTATLIRTMEFPSMPDSYDPSNPSLRHRYILWNGLASSQTSLSSTPFSPGALTELATLKFAPQVQEYGASSVISRRAMPVLVYQGRTSLSRTLRRVQGSNGIWFCNDYACSLFDSQTLRPPEESALAAAREIAEALDKESSHNLSFTPNFDSNVLALPASSDSSASLWAKVWKVDHNREVSQHVESMSLLYDIDASDRMLLHGSPPFLSKPDSYWMCWGWWGHTQQQSSPSVSKSMVSPPVELKEVEVEASPKEKGFERGSVTESKVSLASLISPGLKPIPVRTKDLSLPPRETGESEFAYAAVTLARIIGRKAQLSSTDTVLDVGFGAGDSLLLWLQEFQVKEICGIEPVHSQLEQAAVRVKSFLEKGTLKPDLQQSLERQRNHEEVGSSPARYYITSADQETCVSLYQGIAPQSLLYLLPSESFTKVIAVDCAYHFQTREEFFHQSFRVLETGGRLVFSDLVVDYSKLGLLERVLMRIGGYFAGYPLENMQGSRALIQQMEAAGFTRIQAVDVTAMTLEGFIRFVQRHSASYRGPNVDYQLRTRWGRFQGLARLLRWLIRKGILRMYIFTADKKGVLPSRALSVSPSLVSTSSHSAPNPPSLLLSEDRAEICSPIFEESEEPLPSIQLEIHSSSPGKSNIEKTDKREKRSARSKEADGSKETDEFEEYVHVH